MSDVVKKENNGLAGLGFTISAELIGQSGGMMVTMGEKISNRVLDKYKGSKDKVDRIAFIIDTPIVVKYHYFEDMGYIQCFGGDCCELDPQPAKIRYLFPIIKYDSNAKGAARPDCSYEVLVLSAGNDFYSSIVTAHETSIEDGHKGITTFDYKIQCTDEQYQKLQLTATTASIWKERQDVISDIKERWETIAKNITKAIAKSITPQNFAKAISGDEDVEDDIETAEIVDTKTYYEED